VTTLHSFSCSVSLIHSPFPISLNFISFLHLFSSSQSLRRKWRRTGTESSPLRMETGRRRWQT
ncbi:unnamed protein product, partial [Prunus brigantina]